jgi:hypothetical protein
VNYDLRSEGPILLQCARWLDTPNAVLKLLDAEYDGCTTSVSTFHPTPDASRLHEALRTVLNTASARQSATVAVHSEGDGVLVHVRTVQKDLRAV